MKKITVCFLTTMLLFTFMNPSLNAATKFNSDPITETTTRTVENTEAKNLMSRLDEIKAMDKSKLSSAEKKELRKESRMIKKQLKAIGGGVYLSAGAIIIIALLLILLL